MTTDAERFVVDTHSLIWHLTDDDRLSPEASRTIRRGEAGDCELILPIIVLAELLRIAEKQRVNLAFVDVVEWMVHCPTVAVVPFDLPIFSDLIGFGGNLELHDRIIAATAKRLGAKVITRDRDSEGVVETLW